MRRGKCKYCGREIVWVRSGAESWKPYERIRQVFTLEVVLADWVAVLRELEEEAYQPHSLVCSRSSEEIAPPAPAPAITDARNQ